MKMVRGIIVEVTEGDVKRVTAEGRAAEEFTDREYFQHYGFTSRPKPDAEGIFLKQGNNIIQIATDDRRYRVAIDEGEVCIYTDEGDKIHFKRNKTIQIVSGNKLQADVTNDVEINTIRATVTATESVTVNSPLLNIFASAININPYPGGGTPETTINGNVTINGNITQVGNKVQQGTVQQTGDMTVTGNIYATQITDSDGNVHSH